MGLGTWRAPAKGRFGAPRVFLGPSEGPLIDCPLLAHAPSLRKSYVSGVSTQQDLVSSRRLRRDLRRRVDGDRRVIGEDRPGRHTVTAEGRAAGGALATRARESDTQTENGARLCEYSSLTVGYCEPNMKSMTNMTNMKNIKSIAYKKALANAFQKPVPGALAPALLTRAPLGYSAERAPLGGGRFCPLV